MPITLQDTTITGLGVDGLPAGTVGSASLANTTIQRANIGYAGQILQAQTVNKTDTFSGTATAGSYTAITGLSVNITPFYSTSKIFIIFSIAFDSTRSNSGGGFAIFRGGSLLTGACGQAVGVNYRVYGDFGAQISAGQTCMHRGGHHLDNPGTTSTLTYDMRFTQDSTGFTTFINRSRNDDDNTDDPRMASTLTVLEISG
jgi:hypothetical protein